MKLARIREVVRNLVENGIKFTTPLRQPRIYISATRHQGRIFCRDEDNGPGIEPSYHEKAFGLFDRLDSGVPGNGVGLALVKRIVEIHNGAVWVEPQGNGHGCCFCFTLPFQKGA
jgi:signal transduction histidine kinase